MRSFVICFLHLQNRTIVVALISYFVDEIKVTNLSKTMIIHVTIALSMPTTNYALPPRANKNKVKTTLALDLMWSCKFDINVQDSIEYFCFCMLLFSVLQYITIELQRMLSCYVRQELRIIPMLTF